MHKLNKIKMYRTPSGLKLISPSYPLKPDSTVKIESGLSGAFGHAQKLSTFTWTEEMVDECELLGSFESLEAAEAAFRALKTGLEAEFL